MSLRTTRRQFLGQSAAGLLGAGLVGCESRQVRSDLPARRPNIVFIFDDQLRACDCGFNGGKNVATPNLDRLAREGVVFSNGLSTCPLCTPYRGMLMTGRYPTHSGLVINFVENNPNEYCIAEAFRDSGYDTGFIGKWHLSASSRKYDGPHLMTEADRQHRDQARAAFLENHPEPEFVPPGPSRLGFDYWAAYNFHVAFQHPFYYRDTPERLIMPRYETDAEMDLAIDYMKAREESERPFFLVVAPHPPHPPWNAAHTPAGYLERVPSQLSWRKNVRPDAIEKIAGDPRCYYAMIANFDDALGRLVAYLDQSGLSENTLVVVTADHGEMLASHGRHNKMVPYEEAVGIPLVMRWPGRLNAGKSDALYTPMDHLPTLCALAGIPVPATAEGVSLAECARGGRGPSRDSVLMMNYSSHWDYFQTGTQWPEWRGVRTRSHTYARWLDGREELYDNLGDPFQLANLVEGGQDLPTLRRLRAALAEQLAAAHDGFLPGTAYAAWYDDGRNLVRTALGPL